MTTTIAPSFNAGGLASGLDTNSIVDALVKLESQPITDKQNKQVALRSQISLLAQISASVGDFGVAAKALGSGGALSVQVSSTNAAFSAITGIGAQQGNYSLAVQSLASSAKARSTGFTSADAPVKGGTLSLNVQGTNYSLLIADGTSLAEVATAIRQSGAPVSVAILDDGTSSYLSITNQNTGHAIGSPPESALSISETSSGSQGQALGLAVFQTASNATFTIDQLPFERQSNTVVGAVPGTTLTLKGVSPLTVTGSSQAEDLVLTNDVAGTATKLNQLVSAYNSTIALVQKQLAVGPATDRISTLAGDSTIRSLQTKLQSLISAQVPGLGTVRSLADLGVKTAQDGTLSLDENVLKAAVASDPGAVDALFTTATTGLAAQVQTVVDSFTDPISGALTSRSTSLTGNVKKLDDDILVVQRRVDQFKQTLIAQFTAMESIVASLKSMGTLLNQIGAGITNNSSNGS